MGSVGQDINKIKDWLSQEGGSGGGTPQEIDISKLGNATLQDIEGKIRNLSREQLYVFDENDKLVAGYQGDKTSVSFPTDLLQMQGVTVTHGHPKGMEEFGGTFSFADINNMLRSNWAEHRATASGQGEMNYIMRSTNNANPRGLRNKINRDYQKLQRNISDTYKKAYDKTIKSGGSRQNARHVARQSAVGLLNRYYKNTMSKYGYEYITRKEAYEYGR